MEIKFSTKPYLPAVVVSVVLFITTFLPWATASALGMSFSSNGTEDWGVLTLIMSIIGAGLSFVLPQRIRSLGLIIAGLLALVGAAIYWSHLSGITVGFGLIIALLASLALMYIGYMDYRKLAPPAKPSQPSQPPQANPPAPPPAPPAQK